MPKQDSPKPSPSPFEIVTPSRSKKIGNKGLLVAVLIVVFLILSIAAGVLLVRQQQNVAEQASPTCPGSEDCAVSNKKQLVSCNPPQTSGGPNIISCNTVGRVETCGAGVRKYCCPSVGGDWTTDMTKCPTKTASPISTRSPTPTASSTLALGAPLIGAEAPTATPTSTPIGTATASATPTSLPTATSSATPIGTATASATPTATARAIPVTGTDWPTILGAGIGAAAIIVSILLAI